MERKTLYKLLLVCTVLIISLPIALAALQDQISRSLEIFKNVNIPELYDQNWQFFDFTFYLILFIGILNSAPQNFLGNKASRVLLGIAAAGISTVGAAVIGFKLAELGLLFFAIALTAIGTAAYLLLRNIGFGGVSGGLVAFLLVWFFMSVFGDRVMSKLPPEFGFIKDIYGVFGGLLLAAGLFALGIILTRIFGMSGAGTGERPEVPAGGGGGGGGGGPPGGGTPPTAAGGAVTPEQAEAYRRLMEHLGRV